MIHLVSNFTDIACVVNQLQTLSFQTLIQTEGSDETCLQCIKLTKSCKSDTWLVFRSDEIKFNDLLVI